MDFAREIKRLHDEGWSCEQLAHITCKTEHYVREYIRLVEQGEVRLICGVEPGIFPIKFATQVASTDDSQLQNVLMDAFSADLALHRQHVYVATGVGLAVLDVSDATNPGEVHYWDFPYRDGKPDIQQGWVEGVDLDGDALYVALGRAGMATFDISDPARPAHLATIAAGTWGNEVVIEPRRKLLSYTGQEQFALAGFQ